MVTGIVALETMNAFLLAGALSMGFTKVQREITGGKAALRNRGLITSLISITIYNVP